jgi:hypothetical protein
MRSQKIPESTLEVSAGRKKNLCKNDQFCLKPRNSGFQNYEVSGRKNEVSFRNLEFSGKNFELETRNVR